ncbi:MAG: amidase family protein [Actinomycetota bacterium]|nr:amidase family protein [Actinomycetota bacterium]
MAAAAITVALLAAPLEAVGSPVVVLPGRGDCRANVRGLNLNSATIAQLQKALRRGRITSEQLVRAYLKRIRAYDKRLNAIRHLNDDAVEQARRADRLRRQGKARGVFFGIPVLLKDNVNTKDMPTTAGSIALKGSVPNNDAFITRRLEGAGAIILGKLNLSEFAGWVDLTMPPGYSSLGGQVVNAYSFALSPSGSSSGSGVAASMAYAAATVGTETSGSILSPSDANSVVGIKPTVGLVSRTGILPLSPSFDTAGPMVRSVSDAAAMLGVVAGRDRKDPATDASKGNTPKGMDYTRFLKKDALKGVRIGFSPEDRDDLNDAEEALFRRALQDLRKQGAKLVESDLQYWAKWVGLTEIGAIPNEFKASLNEYLAKQTSPKLRVRTLTEIIAYNEKHPDKMKYGQGLLEISDMTRGDMNDPAAIANRIAAIQSARLAIDGALLANDLDAIVAPGPAYANVSASAGYPTVMVPGGYSPAGIPMGISFLASGFDEPKLISFAYDYEQASKRRQPPTTFNSDLRRMGC